MSAKGFVAVAHLCCLVFLEKPFTKVAAWRITSPSKYLVTPIYKPFRLFGRGTTSKWLRTMVSCCPLSRLDLLTMVINRLATGMILQVVVQSKLFSFRSYFQKISTSTPAVSWQKNPYLSFHNHGSIKKNGGVCPIVWSNFIATSHGSRFPSKGSYCKEGTSPYFREN